MGSRRKLIDVVYMARDFFRIIRGKDYFHQLDLPGQFFSDGRFYYIDFRGKIDWQGEVREEVPVLYFPTRGKALFFPSMILQYGLGCLDRYFETGSASYMEKIQDVCRWIVKHINAEGHFDNLFSLLHTGADYYSNNSAMTQGEALSFLARVVQNGLVQSADGLRTTMDLIYSNMIMEVEKDGTTLYVNEDVYLCEYCRKDNYIVLNGWIFGIFGLYDYEQYLGTKLPILESTLNTLERQLDAYIVRGDRWSYYDNKRRLSSPIYQVTHISLLDALYRITHRQRFQIVRDEFMQGNNATNRCKYTLIKVMDKLRDTYAYSTVRSF